MSGTHAQMNLHIYLCVVVSLVFANFNATDTTHFSKEGAKAIAALVITELKAVVPELAGCFK